MPEKYRGRDVYYQTEVWDFLRGNSELDRINDTMVAKQSQINLGNGCGSRPCTKYALFNKDGTYVTFIENGKVYQG